MFSDEVIAKADKIITSDAMYDTCRVYSLAASRLSGKAKALMLEEYAELHYLYRKRVFDNQPVKHGKYYESAKACLHDAYCRLWRSMTDLVLKYGDED